MERMIYLDTFFCNNFSILDDLNVTYVIPDCTSVSQYKIFLCICVTFKTFKNVPVNYRTIRTFYLNFNSRIITSFI